MDREEIEASGIRLVSLSKAKAIKAKENAVKKSIAKSMKSSGAKGPNTGAGQSVQGKKKSNFEKTLLSV